MAIGWAVGLVLIVEVGLRVALGLGSPVLFVRDARFGYFPLGNQHLHRFFERIDVNRFGMRSAEPPATKGKDEFRILIVGDSLAFGTTMVDQPDIFAEKIQRELAERRVPVRVLNASSPGWAPGNELEFLRAEGLYGADLVALVYNTKDLSQPFAIYPGPALFPTENPRTAIGELWSRYVLPRVMASVRRGQALADPGSTLDARLDPATAAAVMRTIEETRQLVISRGARFIIVFSPVVTPDVVRDQVQWDGARRDLAQWAAAQHVPVLDMTAIFASRNAATVYFDGIHLRPAGNQLVADEFVKWLFANGVALSAR